MISEVFFLRLSEGVPGKHGIPEVNIERNTGRTPGGFPYNADGEIH